MEREREKLHRRLQFSMRVDVILCVSSLSKFQKFHTIIFFPSTSFAAAAAAAVDVYVSPISFTRMNYDFFFLFFFSFFHNTQTETEIGFSLAARERAAVTVYHNFTSRVTKTSK